MLNRVTTKQPKRSQHPPAATWARCAGPDSILRPDCDHPRGPRTRPVPKVAALRPAPTTTEALACDGQGENPTAVRALPSHPHLQEGCKQKGAPTSKLQAVLVEGSSVAIEHGRMSDKAAPPLPPPGPTMHQNTHSHTHIYTQRTQQARIDNLQEQ